MKSANSDHRVRVTKLMIRKAFTDLLREKPVQNIAVQELSMLAGINRGTFYAHYKDIYDLLAQLEEDMLADIRAVLDPIWQNPPLDHPMIDVCRGMYQSLSENADVCAVLIGEHGDKAFVDKLIGYGKEVCISVYSRRFPKASRRRLEYFYAFVSAGCIGLIRQSLAEGKASSGNEIAAMTEQLLLGCTWYLEQDE